MFKDTKQGETHSWNDGCGEPAHNNPKYETMADFFNAPEEEKKTVILDVARKANEEQRKMGNKVTTAQDTYEHGKRDGLKEILEKVEGMNQEIPRFEQKGRNVSLGKLGILNGYNQALSDISALIKTYLK